MEYVQQPPRDEDVFVTDADLSASRPPPNRRAGLRDMIRNPQYQVVAAVLFIFAVLLLWTGIRDGLVDASLLSSNGDNVPEGFALGIIIALPFTVLVFAQGLIINAQQGIPFYRNIIFIRDITQVVFLLAIVTFAYTLITNLQDNFADPETGLRINFNVLQRNDFGVEISQGPDYQEPSAFLEDVGGAIGLDNYVRPGTYTRALITGIYNTLRVVIAALFVTTILGVLVGVGLLSGNWLVRIVSTVYVEIFRNTPLLVQLFLIYGVLTRLFPEVRRGEAIKLPFSIYLHNKGMTYPKINTTDTFAAFGIAIVAGLIAGVFVWRWRVRLQRDTGTPGYTLYYFLGTLLGISAIGLVISLILGGSPLDAESPERLEEVRFGFTQGETLSAEYIALFVGLVLYTAAFIADIVRAGIQSVPKGQIEAARAAGLTGGQTLQLVVLPQAFRLIVPPLTNQYLNLSKNSSLAIAIGYVDLYNISTIASNQSGQAVVFFAVVLVLYLLMSLLISALMNLLNRSLRIQTR